MKFTIAAHALKRALDRCNQIAPASSAIAEERTGVLLHVESERVIFMASDDTMSIRVEVPAEVEEVGEALVKCNAVSSAIVATFEDRSFDGTENFVVLSTNNKNILRITGSTKISEGEKPLSHSRSFPLLNADFFSETPEFDEAKVTHFPAFAFMDGLSLVSHAASKDPSKLNFNCICLTLTDDNVVFAATDGIQIAEYRKAAKVKGLRGSFILGLKFATVAGKTVDPNLESVELYVEDNNIFVRNGSFTLVGALLNTKFPEYGPYMDVSSYKKAVFNTASFSSVLAGMQPSVDAKTHRLVLDAKKSGTAILSTSSTTGEAESSDLEIQTPEDFDFQFNSVLLQNAVRTFTSGTFNFYFDKKGKGVLLQSEVLPEFKTYLCTLKKVA